MSKEFSELHRRILKLRSVHLRALASFNAFEQIQIMRAPNVVGRENAARNARAMGAYKGFFNTAEKALNLEFLISLAKLFDNHKDALHIDKLVNFAEQNQRSFTAEDFAEYNEGRIYLAELKDAYEGMKREDLLEVKNELANVEEITAKLKIMRDKLLAHIELNEPVLDEITYEEIAMLINTSERILNLVSSKVNHDTAYFGAYQEQVIEDTRRLIGLVRKSEDR